MTVVTRIKNVTGCRFHLYNNPSLSGISVFIDTTECSFLSEYYTGYSIMLSQVPILSRIVTFLEGRRIMRFVLQYIMHKRVRVRSADERFRLYFFAPHVLSVTCNLYKGIDFQLSYGGHFFFSST